MKLRHPGIGSLAFILRICEPFMVMVCSMIAYAARLGFEIPEENTSPMALTAIAMVLYAMGAGTMKLYRHFALRNLLPNVPRLIAVITVTFMTVLILLFLFKISAQFSRLWLVLWYGLTIASLIGVRWWVMAVADARVREGRWTRKVAILGTNAKALELVRLMSTTEQSELRLVGIYSLEGETVDTSGLNIRQAQMLKDFYFGDLNVLLDHGQQMLLDDVIITEDMESLDLTDTVLNKLQTLAVNVYYCLPMSLSSRVGRDGLPLIMVFKKPMEGHSYWLKRAVDVVASLGILTVFSPVFGAVALLVKLSSPGPVFFRQSRGGFNGQAFEMMKFRSMRVGAEAILDDNGKEAQATRSDPRITWIGNIIRKTSLDELPQLINVLRGDMSLVGPRPHVPSHNTYYENLIDTYASRHKMKPGLTGWAQLNGWRGETETLDKMAKRVEFDIWYTENWSFWLDIKIIFLTPFVTIFQRTAY